jgi:hypothetical protein
VQLAMFEIYNESVRDLLPRDDDVDGKFRPLDIRRGADGTFIDGLQSVDVALDDILAAERIIALGFARR